MHQTKNFLPSFLPQADDRHVVFLSIGRPDTNGRRTRTFLLRLGVFSAHDEYDGSDDGRPLADKFRRRSDNKESGKQPRRNGERGNKNKRRGGKKKKEGVGTKKWWRGVSIFGGRVEVGRRRERVPAARRTAVYSDVLLGRAAIYLDSLLMTRMRAPFSSRRRAFSSRRRDVSVRPWSPLSSSSSSEIFLSRARRSRFSASLREFRLFS